jgi:hypothetical protein
MNEGKTQTHAQRETQSREIDVERCQQPKLKSLDQLYNMPESTVCVARSGGRLTGFPLLSARAQPDLTNAVWCENVRLVVS